MDEKKNIDEQFESYVIKVQNQDDRIMFYATDAHGFGRWTAFLSCAKRFYRYKDAEDILNNDPGFTLECENIKNVLGDGSINPPAMLHKAVGLLTEEKPKGHVFIQICRIELKPVSLFRRDVEKKFPK